MCPEFRPPELFSIVRFGLPVLLFRFAGSMLLFCGCVVVVECRQSPRSCTGVCVPCGAVFPWLVRAPRLQSSLVLLGRVSTVSVVRGLPVDFRQTDWSAAGVRGVSNGCVDAGGWFSLRPEPECRQLSLFPGLLFLPLFPPLLFPPLFVFGGFCPCAGVCVSKRPPDPERRQPSLPPALF